MALLPKIVPTLPRRDDRRQAELERALIRRESAIGGQLFGPVPKGHKRSFFCLDEHTWIWHEEWAVKGQRRSVTTRYDVRPSGVIKSQDGVTSNQLVTGAEARNLYNAVLLYQQRVDAEYQRMLQAA